MSTSRYFDRICAVVLAFTLTVTVLFMNGQSFGIELMVDADSEAHSDNEYFTENDEISDWDTASATYISLVGDSITVSGNNAYEYEGNLVIAGSGKFVVSGTLDDGYITVDANANSKVWILLDGVDISCSDNACLRVDEADKVFLTLAEGTANTLSGGGELSDEALEDGSYGVIFAHDDLTINGSGSLQINAGYKHGIKANDDLVITGGTITIDAPADGIHVNDSFRLKEASVSITAGDDGILTENEESYFYLESGNITLSAEGDGIHSNGDVMIAGGTITMDAGDDGIHADGDVEIEDGLIARVRALLRRSDQYTDSQLQIGNLVLDQSRYEISACGQTVRLTNKEYQLLELFARHPGVVFSSDHLMEKIWGWDSESDTGVVWTHIGFIRKKLRTLQTDVEIRTIRGAGYALEVK